MAGGTFELFGHFKRLVHRVGFLCWVSPLALEPRYMEARTRREPSPIRVGRDGHIHH